MGQPDPQVPKKSGPVDSTGTEIAGFVITITHAADGYPLMGAAVCKAVFTEINAHMAHTTAGVEKNQIAFF